MIGLNLILILAFDNSSRLSRVVFLQRPAAVNRILKRPHFKFDRLFCPSLLPSMKLICEIGLPVCFFFDNGSNVEDSLSAFCPNVQSTNCEQATIAFRPWSGQDRRFRESYSAKHCS